MDTLKTAKTSVDQVTPGSLGLSRRRIARSLGRAILVLGMALSPLASASETNVIRDGQCLSMDFRDTALKVVLEQLQSDGKITVRIPPSLLERTVTVKFQKLEVDPALETLFKSASLRNFAIVHEPGPHGRITVVLIDEGKPHDSVPASHSVEPLNHPVIGVPPDALPFAANEASGELPQNLKHLPLFAVEQTSRPGSNPPMAEPVSVDH